jgi:hypothetical protein
MPASNTKFTDHNLKLLFGNMLNHYKNCNQRLNNNAVAIYNEMFLAVQYTLESPQGSLYHLELSEKNKAYSAFNAIFYSLPIYKQMTATEQRSFNPPRPQFNVHTVYVVNDYNRYDCYDRFLFNWLLLSSITHNHHHHLHHHSHTGGVHWPSSNHHKHNSNNDDFAKLVALLVIIALAAFAAILAAIAVYYMLSELTDSLERFWYGEGWLKATLMLANTAVFGAGSTLLSLTFASTPLIALAVAAGLNPVGVVIAGTVLLGIIGAGIGCVAMSLLYDSIDEKRNQDALDPTEPQRFRLTDSEEQALLKNNIDPIKVKCAMVALRAEIANVLGNENRIPSFLSRHFGKGAKVQELLQKVRALRNGALSTVEVGDLSFDCRVNIFFYTPPTFYQQVPSTSVNPFADHYPSAPPYAEVYPPQYQ